MNKLIILSLALIPTTIFAAEVPKALRGATITVTTKDGRQHAFTSEEYKVVPRLDKPAAQPVVKVEKELKRNRVKLLGGVGPTDLSSRHDSSKATVNSSSGAVGGAAYERLITDTVSVGGQALTNGTYLLDVGLDF